MPSYYLDIETTGLDPERDKIITIQFMQIDETTCEPKGNLVILKEWESSEKEIIKKFIELSNITDNYPFSFVSVGYNLSFEHNFLLARTKFYGLPQIDILEKPFIDLKSCGVLMNKGQFKGCGLNNLTGKPVPGNVIPPFYEQKKYDEIIKYIEKETEEFIKFAQWLYKEMPSVLERFRNSSQL